MARRRTLSEKRDIIRRLKMGQSIRSINKETGIHRTVIRMLQCVAFEHGWFEDDGHLPSEKDIASSLVESAGEEKRIHPLDTYREDIERWVNEKTSFLLIHEYLSERGLKLSESTIRRYIHREFPKVVQRAVMLRETTPGEIMEVDFGYLGLSYDAKEKRSRKTWVFSARLRHSRSAWREICTDQNQETFYRCIIHAFEHFGGVPQKVVPDNLKAAVVKASFQEPEVNRVFQKLAIHYGFLISPTLPRKPEHKGGVENDVQYIKGNFRPRYRESERHLGHEIPHLEGMQKALEAWDEKIANVRVVGRIGRRPVELFHDEEKTVLKPLPAHRWDPVSWASAKVQESWRIQYDQSFYSVPYQYIGKEVTVLADSLNVVIYFREKEIARHMRALEKWTYRREPHHAPEHLEEFLKTTKDGLYSWASNLGENVLSMCRVLFNRKGVDGLQPVRSLLHLSKTYGPVRLDAACRRALEFDENPTYRTVKTILKRELDTLQKEQIPKIQQGVFRFQRDAEYYGEVVHG